MASTKDESTDTKLVMRARNGDQNAFGNLFLHYRREIYGSLMQVVHNDEVVKDLFHDTYVKAWRYIENLNEPSRFKSWLMAIARNLAIDWLRQNPHGKTVSLEENQETSNLLDKNDNVQVVIEREYIGHVLAKLTPICREVLVLYIRGFSLDEIAQLLGRSVSTVATYLHRARKQFRELYLQNYLQEDFTNRYFREPDPQVVRGTFAQHPVVSQRHSLDAEPKISIPESSAKVSHEDFTPVARRHTIDKQEQTVTQNLSSPQDNDPSKLDLSSVPQESDYLSQSSASQQTDDQQQPSTPVDSDYFPAKLLPRYREMLQLHEEQQLSCAAIAQRLQIDERNVRVLLHRARQQRDALLQQQEPKRSPRRERPINEENLQKLLSGDPFFQRHFHPPYADILRLAYGEALTDQEIATRLDLPLGTVKSSLAQAVSYLNSFQSGT